MWSQSEEAELFAGCTFVGEAGMLVEGETVFKLVEDELCLSGNRQWNTKSFTIPYFCLFTNKTLPSSLMFFRSIPESMRFLRSFSSTDCIDLSSGERSGLMKMPGRFDNLWLCDSASIASQALAKRTSNGRLRPSLYFPSLMQSRMECEPTVCLNPESSELQQLTHGHSSPWFAVQSLLGIHLDQISQH